MAAVTAPDVGDSKRVLDAVRACVRTERRYVTDEREAFEAFADRVDAVEPTAAAPSAGAAQLRSIERTPGLDRVRDAYESTVMDVPHYVHEYGDTYEESVTEEFGPEIGYLLTAGDHLGEQLKRALLSKARECCSEREGLLRTLDIESESISAVEQAIDPIRRELRDFDPEVSPRWSYGALEAEWNRLNTLSGKCEGISIDRQEAIIRQRREFNIPTAAPDIPTYLYHEFEERYPILSLIVSLDETVRTYRTDRERALSRGG
ncbi:DUF7260 family protein [Halobellus sp. GM3]|uniref:DUF7260 family protein n=1 Tax=Halobellus sp. GM3 TaxID=3458410 RepID=UPI00403DC96D